MLTTATALAVTPLAQAVAPPADRATTPTPAPPIDTRTTPPPPVSLPVSMSVPIAPEYAEDQGSVTVTGRDPSNAPDPIRAINLQAFKATQAVDDAIVGPISMAYKRTVPSPFRQGVHNVLYNLREPVVFVNFVLQHKIGKAAETFARFALNSTIGVLGIFDMAKRKTFKLPRRSNGFANTLGFYGVPSGPWSGQRAAGT